MLPVLAAAPSKVPFYVAGGALVLWAVALAVFGITRPGFPGSKGARRGVVGASALLVIAAMTTAVATAGEEEQGAEAATATTSTFDLAADPSGAIAFDRKQGTVRAGAVTIHLTNKSPVGHNVAVAAGSRQLGVSKTITGAETDLKVDLKPGEYSFYCAVPGHRASGMEGTLVAQ